MGAAHEPPRPPRRPTTPATATATSSLCAPLEPWCVTRCDAMRRRRDGRRDAMRCATMKNGTTRPRARWASIERARRRPRRRPRRSRAWLSNADREGGARATFARVDAGCAPSATTTDRAVRWGYFLWIADARDRARVTSRACACATASTTRGRWMATAIVDRVARATWIGARGGGLGPGS